MADTDPATHAYPALHGPLHCDVVKPLIAPYRPASHGPLQLAFAMPAVAPYRPALQFRHTPDPVSEYVPGGQIDTVGVNDPAGHA